MDICMIAEDYPPLVAGGSRFVYEVSKRLARENNITVVTSNYAHADAYEKDGAVKVYRNGRNRFSFFLLSFWKLLKLNPELYHGHGVLPAFSGKLAGLLKRKPVILHIHGYRDRSVSGFFKYHLQNFIIRLGYSKIICSDELASSAIKKLGVKESKIEVVNSGVDLKKFMPERKDKESKKIFLFVGRLVSVKGLDCLLKAIKILKDKNKTDFELWLVGEGSKEQELKLFTDANNLANVKFLGKITPDKIQDIYGAADFFVLPSMSEGHPLVLLEAMASGLPVIASDITNLKELVSESAGGFVFNTGDPESLAGVFNHALNMKDNDYSLFSENTRKYVEEHFSWEKTSDRIASIEHTVLKD